MPLTTIGTAAIDDNAITTAKIATGAVGTTDLADDPLNPSSLTIISA